MEMKTGYNSLEQLRRFSVVVADTGDLEAIKKYQPDSATTNPSLILKAVEDERYKHYLEKIIHDCQKGTSLTGEKLLEAIMEEILVTWGKLILDLIPGNVSTEMDARLSFDAKGSIEKAHQIIEKYKDKGIAKERVLIKLASTWEGIQAAKVLQKEGIFCNLTLLFSLPQAALVAQAGATVMSPFVGRIYDWYRKQTGKDYTGKEDPGVHSVTQIYHYCKRWGYKTEILAASFRNISEIIHLAGCDRVTISPQLLEELTSSDHPIEKMLSVEHAQDKGKEKLELDEKSFRYLLNKDPMAHDLLADGIRRFAADTEKLENIITTNLT